MTLLPYLLLLIVVPMYNITLYIVHVIRFSIFSEKKKKKTDPTHKQKKNVSANDVTQITNINKTMKRRDAFDSTKIERKMKTNSNKEKMNRK